MKMIHLLTLLLIGMILLMSCSLFQPAEKEEITMPEQQGSLVLQSPAFAPQGAIPAKYSCDGEDVSPPLEWSGAPADTKSFALIVDDPDAPIGTFNHWILFNIPASVNQLPEGVPRKDTLADGSRQGKTSWRKVGYGGPCPPSGTHRYFFKLYALDTMLNLPAGATKEEVLQAMSGHILATGELMGTYKRR